MSIWSHHTTRAEAARIARALRATYNVTVAMFYGYVATVIERIAGMDGVEQREVRRIIEHTISTMQEED